MEGTHGHGFQQMPLTDTEIYGTHILPPWTETASSSTQFSAKEQLTSNLTVSLRKSVLWKANGVQLNSNIHGKKDFCLWGKFKQKILSDTERGKENSCIIKKGRSLSRCVRLACWRLRSAIFFRQRSDQGWNECPACLLETPVRIFCFLRWALAQLLPTEHDIDPPCPGRTLSRHHHNGKSHRSPLHQCTLLSLLLSETFTIQSCREIITRQFETEILVSFSVLFISARNLNHHSVLYLNVFIVWIRRTV